MAYDGYAQHNRVRDELVTDREVLDCLNAFIKGFEERDFDTLSSDEKDLYNKAWKAVSDDQWCIYYP